MVLSKIKSKYLAKNRLDPIPHEFTRPTGPWESIEKSIELYAHTKLMTILIPSVFENG